MTNKKPRSLRDPRSPVAGPIMSCNAGRKMPKEVQDQDFPGGHPSYYYSRPTTLHCGVLMGSGALVLV